PNWAERVRRLPAGPLAVRELEIPCTHVVCAEVAAHGFEGVLLRHASYALSDDDAQLRLVVRLRDERRDHDRLSRPDERRRPLREQERLLRELGALLLRVVAVVEADA